MKFLLLITVIIYVLIHISYEETTDEFCSKPAKGVKFWKCSLRKLPSYYRKFFEQLADCVIIKKGFSNRNRALVYFACTDTSLLDKVVKCFERKRSKINGKPTKADENKAAGVFDSCFRRAFPEAK
ncbi:uncharacterized protein LOC111625013 [Centruroides sculpturatus]|uniref:uncharacterized protein LOC111625013 n=1 Tax=Centruroides sculpturatus TaxID=218467 RepID=UPI000C6ECB7B|nr:uncharacterized protein LOC111625013 [Centruroides sculpturatus]